MPNPSDNPTPNEVTLEHKAIAERETIDIATEELKPAMKVPRWRWLIDRDPLFLLSGVCMLAGCFLISRYIHELDPSEIGHNAAVKLLIMLIVVLNVYEFAVIGLGLGLAKSKTLVRDSRHLLGLALVLLVDFAFVYNETSTVDPRIGLAIAGAAGVLACGKAWWIARSLAILPTIPAAGVTAAAMLAMYAMPIVVREFASDGFLSQTHAMAVWTGVGLLVAMYALPGA